jgi:hypothetical protein
MTREEINEEIIKAAALICRYADDRDSVMRYIGRLDWLFMKRDRLAAGIDAEARGAAEAKQCPTRTP